jgi:hypothetical protein
MDTVHEEWRPVPGAAGRYSVSNLGRVRREVYADANGRVRPRGIVKGSADTCGYLRVRPYARPDRTVIAIHRLVAHAFHGPCPDGHEVNHIDGNRQNNRASNLEYVTHRDNVRHSWRLGNVRRDGEHNGRAKLTSAQARDVRFRVAAGESPRGIARSLGVADSTVHQIANGSKWRHAGGPIRRPIAES